MNSKRFCSILAMVLFSGTLLTQLASAQYTGDNQTNSISGVVSNWVDLSSGTYTNYDVGYASQYDALFIENGGGLNNGNGSVGLGYSNPYAENNIAIVSGNGSTWNNNGDLFIGGCWDFSDALIITNGGVVYDNIGQIGTSSSLCVSPNDSVLVTGAGSVWSNRNDLFILGSYKCTFTVADGAAVFNSNATAFTDIPYTELLVTGKGSMWNVSGSIDLEMGSQMIVSNGGLVRCDSASLDRFGPAPQVVVTGTGSVWSVGGSVLGDGIGESVTVADGGVVSATSLKVAQTSVSGGNLYLGLLEVVNMNEAGATLTLNGGTVNAGNLIVGSPYSGIYQASDIFNKGTLRTKATTIANLAVFAIGDGTNLATFILDSGGSGIHSFANGLTISSNALLTGCGTIDGSVVIEPGGKVLTDCGGKLTFSGVVTNNGTMRAGNGSVFEYYGTFVNNGTLKGTLDFHGVFVNHGVVLTAQSIDVSAIAVSGRNVVLRAPSLRGYIYQLEASTSLATPNWRRVGVPQYGTGRLLTLIDYGGTRNGRSGFYRVRITIP
jgi:T5SS/PEP-CTERM-associated repeat protein